MITIDSETIRKSFKNLRTHIARTTEEINSLRASKVYFSVMRQFEDSSAVSDKIYSKFFNLYAHLSKDIAIREEFLSNCKEAADKQELEFQLSSLSPLLDSLSKNLEDLFLGNLNGFEELLKSSGRGYAKRYIRSKN